MIILLLIYLLSIALSSKPSLTTDMMKKENTTAINGIFVGLVFFSHFMQYATMDVVYTTFFQLLNQLSVTTFLFFSGYGVATSYRNKGEVYLSDFPKRRILKLLLQFSCAIICFLLLNLFLQKEYSIIHILLSFIGWTSIGNSNWYIFVMLSLYVLFYLSFSLFSTTHSKRVGVWLLSGILMVVLVVCGKPNYWYNTLLVFPAGISFAYNQQQCIAWIKKYIVFILIAFIISGMGREITILYELHAILFIAIIIYLMSIVQTNSKVFTFLGSHVFSIYILQRIAFILLQSFIWPSNILYFICAVGVTLFFAYVFDSIVNRLVRKIL